MTMTFYYSSPETPAGPGWTEDLGNTTVRLGSIAGFITEAELGSVGISSLQIDDPLATVGHAADAIVGLKQFRVKENTAPSGQQTIWIGYVGDRRYRRGPSSSPSLIQGVARVIDATLVDLNTFLSFRLFQPESLDATSSFNRPEETDVERVAALLAVDFLSTTLFDNGLVETAEGVDMDAVDYTGQRPADVLNDCAQQSGRNFFVYYDEAAGQFSLFYHYNGDPVYTTTMRVSNERTDVDSSTTWWPLLDAELYRDPSRVIAGALSTSPVAYENNLATSYAYGYRDALIDSVNLKTSAAASARAIRYLAENNTEDDRITFTVKLPAANVNDWYQGQLGSVRFLHLPGYEEFRSVRCLQRKVAQDEQSDAFYNVTFECTPVAVVSEPSGAFGFQITGNPYSGQPILPRETTPGNVLLLVAVARGGIGSMPGDIRMLDNPSVPPATPEVPPFPDHAGWTVLATVVTDHSGMNINGPCAGFNTTPYCTHGYVMVVAWRYVQAGERTTVPVAVSTEENDAYTSAWVWELGATEIPVLVDTIDSTHASNPDDWTFASDPGNVFGVLTWAQADSGHENATATPDTDVETLMFRLGDNSTVSEVFTGWNPPLVWLGNMPDGGALGMSFGCLSPTYTSVNGCGIAFTLPADVELSDIPYPGNQSA